MFATLGVSDRPLYQEQLPAPLEHVDDGMHVPTVAKHKSKDTRRLMGAKMSHRTHTTAAKDNV